MKKLSKQAAVTIPVIVDSVKKFGRFKMSRCSYFSIQCDQPSIEWSLDIQKKNIPFLMVGMSGIITRPSVDSSHFDGPGEITGLFETVEADPDLYIDHNDVWLPNHYLIDVAPAKPLEVPVARYKSLTFKPIRNFVFRLSQDLFQAAYQYRTGDISRTAFEKMGRSFAKPVAYSETETIAFIQWQFNMIEEIYNFHHQPGTRNLKRKK